MYKIPYWLFLDIDPSQQHPLAFLPQPSFGCNVCTSHNNYITIFTASSSQVQTKGFKRQLFGDVTDDHDHESAKKRQRCVQRHESESSRFDFAKVDDANKLDGSDTPDPCPMQCPCRIGHVKAPWSKIPRREGFRTITPLYKKFLKRRLLRETNTWFYTCCSKECSGRWSRKRPTARQVKKDYNPSNLSVTHYSWGQWRTKQQ